ELWNAVQATLSGNLTQRRHARIESGALLAGLIFDDRSNRMSPTYTVRRGKRYPHFISQAYLRGGGARSRPRISADKVERVVVEATCRQQSHDSRTTDFSTGIWSAEIRELVRNTVDRIVIHRDDMEITLKVEDLNGTINNDNHSQNLKTLR